MASVSPAATPLGGPRQSTLSKFFQKPKTGASPAGTAGGTGGTNPPSAKRKASPGASRPARTKKAARKSAPASAWTENAKVLPVAQRGSPKPKPKKDDVALSAGATVTKTEAKQKYVLTDSDLKRLPSSKVGGRIQLQVADVLAAALKKHRGEAGLQKARETAKRFSQVIDGKSLEQHRRTLGDAVKAHISVEKWCIAARTHCSTHCELEVFQSLVVPNADSVTPEEFSEETPVVVAALSRGAADVFGSTKLTGGTRMGSWSADKMELVFFPPTGELRCWWTMS